MGLNLYPYNYYILYGALAILGLVIILTGIRLIKAAKPLKDLEPVLADINTRSEKAKQFATSVEKKGKESVVTFKNIALVFPIIYTVYKAYRNRDDKTKKKYRETAEKIVQERLVQELSRGELLRLLSK